MLMYYLVKSKCKNIETTTTMGNKKRWHQCEMNYEEYDKTRKPVNLEYREIRVESRAIQEIRGKSGFSQEGTNLRVNKCKEQG